ncbi:MAG: poly-beta-1,6-N-acetyl-D-glucosamine biosynthesis protein PgaD [Lysobacter sp.]
MNAQTFDDADRQVIFLPHRQHRAKRTFYGVMTLLAWAVYAYLWLPLLTLVLWLVGVRLSYIELYLRDQRLDAALLVTLPLLLLACATLLIGWAEYNRLRFRGRERRTPRQDVRDDEVALALGAPPELGAALLDAHSAVLTMDTEGRPLAVRVGCSLPG